MLPVPIVLTAFGTTTRARETYDFMDGLIRAAFPGRDLLWAFSSRMVRDRLKDKKKFVARHPHEVLRALADQGHEWAVVQSVHLLCGHEFYRMIDEVQTQPIRTSIGLPLLSSWEDYLHLARALGLPGDLPPGEALVLVGHGTDHPAWAAYPALESILRCRRWGEVRSFPSVVADAVEDSWQAAFTGAGLEVTVTPRGIGLSEAVVDIFIDHLREALEIIPGSDREAAFAPAMPGLLRGSTP